MSEHTVGTREERRLLDQVPKERGNGVRARRHDEYEVAAAGAA